MTDAELHELWAVPHLAGEALAPFRRDDLDMATFTPGGKIAASRRNPGRLAALAVLAGRETGGAAGEGCRRRSLQAWLRQAIATSAAAFGDRNPVQLLADAQACTSVSVVISHAAIGRPGIRDTWRRPGRSRAANQARDFGQCLSDQAGPGDR